MQSEAYDGTWKHAENSDSGFKKTYLLFTNTRIKINRTVPFISLSMTPAPTNINGNVY
jgi:hypothetical protein